TGGESALADGVQLAMAIAPPTTGTRVVLASDGNETAGDLAEAARIAAANNIPIDVLPLTYRHEREVAFKRLDTPPTARSNQTISLRFVLSSTHRATGRLTLTLNDSPVDLDPNSPDMSRRVELNPGTNVEPVSLPVGTRGVHRFRVMYEPDDPAADGLDQNNQASGVTYVAGPGHVLVVGRDQDTSHLLSKLKAAGMDVRGCVPGAFPETLAELVNVDAVVPVNCDVSDFTHHQQTMICRYVRKLGGGMVMIGGDNSFGAGGWIGSPVAEILPVDPDPPQKKQMPKGALVLVMHACEMPRGNYWGKQVAIAAVKTLSRRDLVGVLDYGWRGGAAANWVYPLSPAGDKSRVIAAIRSMQMGDMPDFGPPMRAAYNALSKARAGQKHIIIISDGDPASPSTALIGQMRKARITCSTVSVFPHGGQTLKMFHAISRALGGREYNVKDPKALPQIFIKEAQIVRRSLIVEEPFTPKVTNSLSELVRGFQGGLPNLDGYVLTGPKHGLTQLVLTTEKGDPILAHAQMGLGRTVAFTSGVSSKWGGQWTAWGGYERFWEQVLRWAGKSSQASDCDVFADVLGRQVTVTVDAVDESGAFVQFADLRGYVITPSLSTKELALTQVGPGRYRAGFTAGGSGSYLVNLRYRKAGAGGGTGMVQTVVTVPYAPEFRDLSDNMSLLSTVAKTTGGRILPPKPSEETALFDRAGVRFPFTAVPLTQYLFLTWLGLFLLDVAIRRIVLDFRAIARRMFGWVGRLRRGRTRSDKTVDQLRARTRKVRRGLATRSTEPQAGRRYEAGEAAEAPLPVTGVDAPKAERAPAEPAKEPEPAEKEPATHVSRLLKAKRDARGKMGQRDGDSNG
ncbi:MAG: glutamine amidotransferase, partial [Planctomycetota bacterium]